MAMNSVILSKLRKFTCRALLILLACTFAIYATGSYINPPALAKEARRIPAPDFELTDQYGQTWTLADCEGKVVLLNFWTTWCQWCVYEMPDIEAVYHELGENEGDVLIFGVASPRQEYDADAEGIADFFADKGWTYPVLMDTENALFNKYGIQSFPTTYMLRADGTIYGYLAGAMDKETIFKIIELTQEDS